MATSQPCASTLGPRERKVSNVVAAMVGLAGVGGAVALVATNLSNPAVLQTSATDAESAKLARSAARGQVTSLTSSLTFGMANLANDYMCDINRLTSSVFMALLFGNIFGFVLDASFASDEGLREYKGGSDNGKKRNLGGALELGFQRMYSRNFVRYVLTLLTDVFVSSVLLDELVKFAQSLQARANAPAVARVILCGPLASALPTILTSVISVVTFMVYTNDTRFSWAFRTNRFPETLDEWALRPEVADSVVPAVQILRHKVLNGEGDLKYFGQTWKRSSNPRGRLLQGPVEEGIQKAKDKQNNSLDPEIDAKGYLSPEEVRLYDVRPHDYVILDDKKKYVCAARDFGEIKALSAITDPQESRVQFLKNMYESKVGDEPKSADKQMVINLALALEGVQPSYQTTNFLLTSSIAAALYLFKDIDGTPRGLKLALVSTFLAVTSGLATVNGLERPPSLSVDAEGTYVGYAFYVAAALVSSLIVMTSSPKDRSSRFTPRQKNIMAVLFAVALSVPPLAAMLTPGSDSLPVGAAALAVCFAAFYAYVRAGKVRGAKSRRPTPVPADSAASGLSASAAAPVPAPAAQRAPPPPSAPASAPVAPAPA